FDVCQHVVHAAAALDLWVEQLGGDGALRRNHRIDSDVEKFSHSSYGPSERKVGNDNGWLQPAAKDVRVYGKRTAADVGRQPVLIVGLKDWVVLFDDFMTELLEIRDKHRFWNLDRLHGSIQTIEMLAQFELLLSKRTRHFENHVAEHQRRVENRNPGVG